MTAFDIAAILVVLAALFGYLNRIFLKLPTTIGLVIIALFVSLAAMGIDALTGSHMADSISAMVDEIDFFDTLMNGMLAFLLFAGALHVELEDLMEQRWAIAIMATVGIAVSAAIVGLGFFWLAGVPLWSPWCSAPSSARPTLSPCSASSRPSRCRRAWKPRSPESLCSTTASAWCSS